MRTVSPVLTEAEVAFEQVVALGSSNYFPIIVTRFKFADGSPGTATRFRFSDKERERDSPGADLVLSAAAPWAADADLPSVSIQRLRTRSRRADGCVQSPCTSSKPVL